MNVRRAYKAEYCTTNAFKCSKIPRERSERKRPYKVCCIYERTKNAHETQYYLGFCRSSFTHRPCSCSLRVQMGPVLEGRVSRLHVLFECTYVLRWKVAVRSCFHFCSTHEVACEACLTWRELKHSRSKVWVLSGPTNDSLLRDALCRV